MIALYLRSKYAQNWFWRYFFVKMVAWSRRDLLFVDSKAT